MKRLTAEELEPLVSAYGRCCGLGTTVAINGPVLLRLLAMASRLVEVESALEFLERRTFPLRSLVPEVLFQQAYEHGWTSPTQKQGDR